MVEGALPYKSAERKISLPTGDNYVEGMLMDIILASASPRRTELLQQIGLVHRVITSDSQECLQKNKSPEENVLALARYKAENVSRLVDTGLVIGADTIVVCDGLILGKPSSLQEARMMLGRLSGRMHQVMTAVAIVDASGKQPIWQCVETTKVTFKPLTEKMMKWYLATNESLDKAGAYGIQGYGALLVEKIEGCYFNVVGLPLGRLAQGLAKFGVDIYA